jgi:serine phosphatase RsbU (regulator of sigma subunit)
VTLNEDDHLLLYTDGVSETLADADGRSEARFASVVERAAGGGARLLDAILVEIDDELAGRPQPDDVTLLTASVLASSGAGHPQ